jgi:hypothetical protein
MVLTWFDDNVSDQGLYKHDTQVIMHCITQCFHTLSLFLSVVFQGSKRRDDARNILFQSDELR